MAAADTAKERFEERIYALLAKYGQELGGGAPFDAHDDEYAWCVVVAEGTVDVSLYICEERCRDGGDGDGIALSIDIVAEDGHVLGSFCPGNYSDELWTDVDGFEARLTAAERIGVEDVRDLLIEYAERSVA